MNNESHDPLTDARDSNYLHARIRIIECGFLAALFAAALFLLAGCGGSSGGSASLISSAVAQAAPTIITTELTQAQANGVPAGLSHPDLANGLPLQCGWAGTAASANISTFYAAGSLPVQFARWTVTLTPNGGGARLIAYDAGDYVITELAQAVGDRTSPWSTGAYVDLNQFIAAGKAYKFIGVQVCGQARVYSSRVEVVYRVSP